MVFKDQIIKFFDELKYRKLVVDSAMSPEMFRCLVAFLSSPRARQTVPPADARRAKAMLGLQTVTAVAEHRRDGSIDGKLTLGYGKEQMLVLKLGRACVNVYVHLKILPGDGLHQELEIKVVKADAKKLEALVKRACDAYYEDRRGKTIVYTLASYSIKWIEYSLRSPRPLATIFGAGARALEAEMRLFASAGASAERLRTRAAVIKAGFLLHGPPGA